MAGMASLIEACRRHHKIECLNLRHTIEAAQNGAKWRSISAASGAVVDGGADLYPLEPP